jgi:hypothetical protein
MILQFTDKDSEYYVRFNFTVDETYVSMSKCDRFPDENGKVRSCGWEGVYKDCPCFSAEARKFIDKALTMKAFW